VQIPLQCLRSLDDWKTAAAGRTGCDQIRRYKNNQVNECNGDVTHQLSNRVRILPFRAEKTLEELDVILYERGRELLEGGGELLVMVCNTIRRSA
jgi:hypothetical protein